MLPKHRSVLSWPVLVLPYLLVAGSFARPVDETLSEGVGGNNVVVAVLEKIEASRIFGNTSDLFSRIRTKDDYIQAKSFLRILAYKRSVFGRKNSTGGIWDISSDEFDATQHYVENNPAFGLTSSQNGFGINWMQDVSHMNMTIPLYSGLAAILLLDEADPVSLSRHSSIWRDHFGGTVAEDWRAAKNKLQDEYRCSIKTDVVYVLDASISISESDLDDAKRTVGNFTKRLMTLKGDNRIGIILIRSTAVVHLSLDKYNITDSSIDYILSDIDAITYKPHHVTNTADALCKLTEQPWRNNAGVLQVAFVLSDGKSNTKSTHSDECKGHIDEVANYLHANHSDILVTSIGIGRDINDRELSLIASRDNVVTLQEYQDLPRQESAFHYQICYTLTEEIGPNREADGAIGRGQIMRWIEHVGGAGVTIRLCVTDGGRISLFISHLPYPSEAYNDKRDTVGTRRKGSVGCTTLFEAAGYYNGDGRKKRNTESDTEIIYIAIVGDEDNSVFHLRTAVGNVTLDKDECKEDHYPCHPSATCHNTDGSFYCECQEGFSGDGFVCAAINDASSNYIFILLSSVMIFVVVVMSMAVCPIFKLWIHYRRRSMCTNATPKFTQEDIQKAKANLKKVDT